MDTPQLEALALGDRAAALSNLIAGTVEHDYWRGVALQHAGDLAAVDRVLADWPRRHGHGQPLQRQLEARQLLLRAGADPTPEVLSELARATSAQLEDRAEVAAAAERFPTALDASLVDGPRLVAAALARTPDLRELTDAGLAYVPLAATLTPSQRRDRLRRCNPAAPPSDLVAAIARDLDERSSQGFGTLPAHAQLTLAELHALAALRPGLRADGQWVAAVLARLQPPEHVDVEHDLAARAAFLNGLWAFADALPPAFNGLRAHVRYHQLALDQRLGRPDRERLRAYLALPRSTAWAAGVPRQTPSDHVVSTGLDGATPAGLARVPDDEPLVRALLAHFLRDEDGQAFAAHLDAAWLATVLAEARLTAGRPDTERWAATLGPARLAELREQVELELAPTNPRRVAADGPVRLDVTLKNVGELLVKVFRIDAVAYFLTRSGEVDTSLDLDGLVASDELVLKIDAPPIQRVARTLELAGCARPGTYVVELIGNGLASRALIRKGGLRRAVRVGAGGPIVTVLDELGRPLADARVWLDGREYAPRGADGAIPIPFAGSPTTSPMLLVHGDLTEVVGFVHPAETYALDLGLDLERESLVPGGTARLLVRPLLSVAGAPASVALLERPTLELAVTDRSGTTSTRTEPLTLSDDAEAVVELRVPDGLRTLSARVRAQVRVASRQETIDLTASAEAELAAIHATAETEALHLATDAAGHVLHLLGKTGEARARRPVALTLRHEAVGEAIQVTLETDEDGTIDLGGLPGVLEVATRLPSGREQRWRLDADRVAPRALHAVAGEPITLPAPVGPWRLVERRRQLPVRDVSDKASVARGALVIDGLESGTYTLHALSPRGPLAPLAITVADRPAPGARADLAPLGAGFVERSPALPLIRSAALEDGQVTIVVDAPGPRTRVHLVGLRYRSEPALPSSLSRAPAAPAEQRARACLSDYVSGRDIGDEHRYVLDRRRAPRRPGTMLEKPPLLLHPWALRTTATSRQDARVGGAFRGEAAPMPAAAPPPAPKPRAAGPSAPDRFAPLEFLARPAAVIANLRADADGRVRVPVGELGHAQLVRVVVVDPRLSSTRELALPGCDAPTRDLRLRLALDPARHFREDRAIVPAPTGTRLAVDDVRTDRLEVLDSVARAHQLLATLGLAEGQAALVELGFVTGWHLLDDATRRARYSRYACHELNLFLERKDPAFFAAVVRPTLAHKRHKTFVDRYLLGEDLRAALDPWAFGRLNTLERVLLARRHPEVAETIARLLADAVDLVPPDPERDARLVATVLGATALERGGVAASAPADEAFLEEPRAMKKKSARRAREVDDAKSAKGGLAAPAATSGPGGAAGGGAGAGGDELAMDMMSREEAEPLYRGADKTQEWAETDWWQRRVSEVHPGLVPPNRFWRDLARHVADGATGPFLSPWVGECTASLPAAMGALAVLDLPLAPAAHAVVHDDTRLELTTGSDALAARTRLVEVAEPEVASTVLVGQAIFRADDRWTWDGAVQREKPVTGALVCGVVYQCQVVVTNPTSASQKLEVLLQIPRGAMPVSSGFITRTVALDLGAFASQALDYAFYFPRPGRASHFPAHVTREGALVAAAPLRELEVLADPPRADAGSWAEVSQHGSLDEVLAFLASANLGRVDLGKIAWRMQDRDAFTRVTARLAERLAYEPRLWAYALVHADRQRLGEWLRQQDELLDATGPLLDGGVAPVDPIARGAYQHLEYAPLIGARAHRLGGQRRILNDGLAAQYAAFLELVAHRPAPTDDDWLAAAHYLFALDRQDDALAALALVRRDAVATGLQYDYVAAYGAACRGDLAAARALAEPWRDHPIDRWRDRFRALLAMLDEAQGAGPARAGSADSRDQKMDELAARQPALDVSVSGQTVALQHANLASCELRYYRMDIELLFSREPFVQGDVERFSWIEPTLVVTVPLDPSARRTTVQLPGALAAANLVVAAVAPGLRRAVAHYAHDLAVELVAAYGQVRVLRASTQRALPATYVKVFARERGGRITFYKDGYTDVRGRFDYATLSTNDLDRVERFALLVASDEAGATVLEAAPPAR